MDIKEREKIGVLVESLREIVNLDLSEYIKDNDCANKAINLICLQQMTIEQQAKTIESLKCCGNCNNKPYAGGIGEIEPRCCLEDDCISNYKWQPRHFN